MDFPPPHCVLYEPLNDIETKSLWNTYKIAHEHECDFEEVDAAVSNSMEDFAKWFSQWTTFVSTRQHVRIRVLMVWHSHFLSLACQQMLRRTLEQRSFRCRVWFHIEEPTLQSAILSRCIIKTLPRTQRRPQVCGPPLDFALWNNPRDYETKISLVKKQEGKCACSQTDPVQTTGDREQKRVMPAGFQNTAT
jgi:hypothetical protein